LVNANMTIAQCAALAAANNAAFYGLENADECYTGNGLASGGMIVDNTTDFTKSQCYSRCAGNFTQICGGGGKLSVYSNPSYKPVTVVPNVGKYKSKGCLQEPTSGSRALTGASMTDSLMTVEKCIKFCLGKRHKYAG